MRRRDFIGAAAVSVLALGTLGQCPQPRNDLRAVHRWHDGHWRRVRMHQLRKGDRFKVEDFEQTFVAANDAEWFEKGRCWGVMGNTL
jgi:hypothetical protein